MLDVTTATVATAESAVSRTPGAAWDSLQLTGTALSALQRGRATLITRATKTAVSTAIPTPRATWDIPGTRTRMLAANGEAKKINVSTGRPGRPLSARIAARLNEIARNARPRSAPDAPASATQRSCHCVGSYAAID